MSTSLAIVVPKDLPILVNGSLTYNAAKNVFLSQGYTSAAGNLSATIIQTYERN